MQYVDHLRYLLECRRVLCPGGTLALHENGSLNPFILVARWVSRFRSAWDKELRSYNATIKAYLDEPPQLEGFLLTFQESYGLLSPVVFILELLGAKRPARWLEPGLVRADATLLKLPAFRRFAWFRVFHLRKVQADEPDHAA